MPVTLSQFTACLDTLLTSRPLFVGLVSVAWFAGSLSVARLVAAAFTVRDDVVGFGCGAYAALVFDPASPLVTLHDLVTDGGGE